MELETKMRIVSFVNIFSLILLSLLISAYIKGVAKFVTISLLVVFVITIVSEKQYAVENAQSRKRKTK